MSADTHQSGNPKFVIVASHRGGSGKTAVATGLATHLSALHHKRVLLMDFSPDGAASWLMLGPDQKAMPADPLEVRFLSLAVARDSEARVVWAPGQLRRSGFWELALQTARSQEMDFVVVDMPVAAGDEFEQILKHAWLVVLTVPCDGPAFRSLGPLLETLNAERSRPNRNFQVRAVMTMTGVPNPERQALENYERRYLRPMLFQTDLPYDSELRRSMAIGQVDQSVAPFPGSAFAALRGLASEVHDLSGADELVTPVS